MKQKIYLSSFFSNNISDKKKISIARRQPRGHKHDTCKALAPNDNVWACKDDPKWAPEYKKQLAGLEVSRVIKGLEWMNNEGEDIVLLCWERDEKDCHRQLVADWLSNAGYETEYLA